MTTPENNVEVVETEPTPEDVSTISSLLSWYVAGTTSAEWLRDLLEETLYALKDKDSAAKYAQDINMNFRPGGKNNLTKRAEIDMGYENTTLGTQ